MPYNPGGYDNALFIFGHSGLQTQGRSALKVSVPRAMCVVNLNEVGKIAMMGQLQCFYDYTLFADAFKLLDPLRYKDEIEGEVNKRIRIMRQELGLGPTSLRDIRLTFTVEKQETPDMLYEMTSQINDDMYALAGIHELGLLKEKWSPFYPVYGEKSPVSCKTIQQCYSGSILPTQAGIGDACGLKTSQTVPEWAECIRSKFEMTTTRVFETAKHMGMGSCIVYNLGCRSGDVMGPQTRFPFHAERQHSSKNQRTLHMRIPSANPNLESVRDDSTCDAPSGCILSGGKYQSTIPAGARINPRLSQSKSSIRTSPGRGLKRSPTTRRVDRPPHQPLAR